MGESTIEDEEAGTMGSDFENQMSEDQSSELDTELELKQSSPDGSESELKATGESEAERAEADAEDQATPEQEDPESGLGEEPLGTEEITDASPEPESEDEPKLEATEAELEAQMEPEINEPTEEAEPEIESNEAELEEQIEPEVEEQTLEAETEEPEHETEAEIDNPDDDRHASAEESGKLTEPAPEAEQLVAEAELEGDAVAESQPADAQLNGSDGVLAEELVEAEILERIVPEPDDGRQWYVVHCYSGYENKVRHNLEQRIETMDMKGKIFDVVVPTEEEMEVREGKRRTVERRVFPGYILVQMIMDEDSWYVVRNTPGVTGFVGMGNEPTPLRPEEVNQIVKRMEAEAPRIKVTYNVGQKVRIIDGPFNDFIGTVDDIDMDKAKVRVMVSFFGRETPVELDFLQVEKA